MKSKVLFLFLALAQMGSAQTFKELDPLDGVYDSSIAFTDVDGDNDPDVLITGWNNSGVPISKLYTNDGSGQFTEKPGAPFEGVAASSIAFADVDGDNDPDVLITGENSSGTPISKLYTNDGSSQFTEKPGAPFDGVSSSSIAFADVDGDNDPDVLITGRKSSGIGISKMYINDGSGQFTEKPGAPFDGVSSSSIAFADVDGDNDPDVLITGENSSFDPIAKLYTNDGSGQFTEKSGAPFNGVKYSSIAFADVDGDNDPDVLITGENSSFDLIAKLYTNDGSGQFTEKSGAPFNGVQYSSIAFADVDGDKDSDVLITGSLPLAYPSSISKLYTNDGSGQFTEKPGTPFAGVLGSSIAFVDVDGDNDPDVLITGGGGWFFDSISKLYTNDGSGQFIEKKVTPFDGVAASSIAFADVDGDKDPDVLITGLSNTAPISKLYINDGSGQFAEKPGAPFDGVAASSIAFSDVDGDNDPDVLITGRNSSGVPISKLYTNDGSGQFTEKPGAPFDGVDESSIAFADVDGDNDPDVLITGEKSSGVPISKLYTNDGSGQFTEKLGAPFDGVSSSSIAFADVDGDNDPDVLITGFSPFAISKLYTNDGSGQFAEKTGTPFDGVDYSSIAFADVDSDNDPDVLITGEKSSGGPISKLYTNDGSGQFTEKLGAPFIGVAESSIAFSDVDGDKDPDVLITGRDFAASISKLYTNDGSGQFTEKLGTPFDGVIYGSVAFADVDGDSDPDVLITGSRISKLYINEWITSSTEDKTVAGNLNFTLFPNPSAAGTLYLNYDAANAGELVVRVYTITGVLISQQTEFAVPGQQTYLVDVSTLPPGNYLIELGNGSGKGVAQFVLK